MSQKKEAYKAGKTHGISGRELFEFNPEYAQGDDEEAGEDDVMVLRREVRRRVYCSDLFREELTCSCPPQIAKHCSRSNRCKIISIFLLLCVISEAVSMAVKFKGACPTP